MPPYWKCVCHVCAKRQNQSFIGPFLQINGKLKDRMDAFQNQHVIDRKEETKLYRLWLVFLKTLSLADWLSLC